MNNNMKPVIIPKGNGNKASLTGAPKPGGAPMEKPFAPNSAVASPIKDELVKLKAAAAAIQHIRISAQHELDMAKRMRAEAVKYQQETETRARSQANQLVLRARLATQKEIEELIGKASAEIQKVLADIRAIRITAQEELAAQHKFTDAARILSMSLSFEDIPGDSEGRRKKQLVFKS
jgi:hypothetical protein